MARTMNPTPLLYTYRRCPYAMRARMALLQAGVAFDAFEIVLRDKPAAMLAISPKGTVPVLQLPTGQVLEQSLDIVRWAFLATGDAEGWWARAQTDENQALIAACDGAIITIIHPSIIHHDHPQLKQQPYKKVDHEVQ